MELPVKITGPVTHGRKLGSKADMPTANIVPDFDTKELKKGVYYSRAYIDGKTYKGITNLGSKPTVKNDSAINSETYIYDFDKDLYGRVITVELLEFRRPEKKFDSVEELFEAMHLDLEAGKNYMN